MDVKIIALNIGGEFITGKIALDILKETGFHSSKFVRYVAAEEEAIYKDHPIFGGECFKRLLKQPTLFHIKDAVWNKKKQNWDGMPVWNKDEESP